MAWACSSKPRPHHSSAGTACGLTWMPRSKRFAQVLVLDPDVVACRVLQRLDFAVAQLAHAARGIADPQFAFAHGLARCDQRVRANDAGMTAGCVRPVVGHVQHRAVLHVAARADADPFDVAAHHCRGPDRSVVAEFDVADHRRRGIDVHARAELRQHATIGPHVGHDVPFRPNRMAVIVTAGQCPREIFRRARPTARAHAAAAVGYPRSIGECPRSYASRSPMRSLISAHGNATLSNLPEPCMPTENPLLSDAPLPAFSRIGAVDVVPAIDTILADYQSGIDRLTAAGSPHDFDHVMLEQERLDQRLAHAWAPVSHLHAVADSKELRAAYEQAEEKITDFASALGQNRGLYAKVQAVADAPGFAQRSRHECALVEHALRDFRLSGVALEEPARTRFREIANELSKLTTAFSNAVLDATDGWQEHIEDERDLAGIPESGRSVLREYARARDLGGWLVTLKQPAVQAVLTYADKRSLRERVYWAYQTRASDQGPDAGKFDNSERMEKILALRHEAAQLLGFANAAEESLATKRAE